jgi:aminoglycoside phosphotransferase (APT) family kinase protein
MNIADALSGRAKLKGIHWLLRSATARKLLRDRLRALLFPGTALGRCHLRHVRYRPGRLLTAYYEMQVQIGTIEAYRPIAVTWGSDSYTDQHHDVIELARMQAEAVHRGVAAPFLKLIADFPEWRMGVWVSPLDTRFTQLLRVSDPQHVRAMLADAYASGSAGSDRHRISDYTVTSIKYRPGKRHVLRYDPVDPAKGGTVFAKLYVGDEGARAFRVTRCAADWLAEHGEGVNCVQPLAYVAEDAVVLYARVYGTPLSAQLRRPTAPLAHHWQRAGAMLNALHRLPEAVAGPLEPHDFVAEVRETARASDHIRALLPQVGAAIDALLDRALEMHQRLPQEPPTFTHGDFKSEHIWVGAGEPTLIDFHSRLADPALDLGKFLADLRLWHATYSRPGLEEAQQSFLAAYGRSVPNERLLRARLYEAVEVVKMAAHGSDLTLGATGRVRLFKRDWALRTARLAGHAQTVINELQFTLGLPAAAVSKPIPQLLSKALPPAASNRVRQSACQE